MKYLRTYAKYLLLIELALAVLLVVGLLVPLPGKVEFKIVQSGSMEPSVPVGALVAIVPKPEYAVGDIITFGDDTRTRIPTTHRIVGVERVDGSTHYRTKGDANEEADNAPVPHSAVVGGVALTVPRLGYVLDFARTQNGYLTMVVIPASLIILDELLTIVMALRTRRQPPPLIGEGRGGVPSRASPSPTTLHLTPSLSLKRRGSRPPLPAGEGEEVWGTSTRLIEGFCEGRNKRPNEWTESVRLGEGLSRSSLQPTTYNLQPRPGLDGIRLVPRFV